MTNNNKLDSSKGDIEHVRHLKMSERLWKLVSKASKNNRSIHDYIITLIENDLIKRKMIKKSDRKKFSSKKSKFY